MRVELEQNRSGTEEEQEQERKRNWREPSAEQTRTGVWPVQNCHNPGACRGKPTVFSAATTFHYTAAGAR